MGGQRIWNGVLQGIVSLSVLRTILVPRILVRVLEEADKEGRFVFHKGLIKAR